MRVWFDWNDLVQTRSNWLELVTFCLARIAFNWPFNVKDVGFDETSLNTLLYGRVILGVLHDDL